MKVPVVYAPWVREGRKPTAKEEAFAAGVGCYAVPGEYELVVEVKNGQEVRKQREVSKPKTFFAGNPSDPKKEQHNGKPLMLPEEYLPKALAEGWVVVDGNSRPVIELTDEKNDADEKKSKKA